jgi:hypothetical protein
MSSDGIICLGLGYKGKCIFYLIVFMIIIWHMSIMGEAFWKSSDMGIGGFLYYVFYIMSCAGRL